MRNPIKDTMDASERNIKVWYGGDIHNKYRDYNYDYNYLGCTIRVYSDSFSKEEMSNIFNYVKDNINKFPLISTVKEIIIDNVQVYLNPKYPKEIINNTVAN